MNLRLSAVLLLCFSKHSSDAQSKVPAPFPCGSGSQLIPAGARCDGYPDCPGGEDEHGCPPPLQEIQLTKRFQAEYQGRQVKKQQSAASQSSFKWQGDFHNGDAILKYSRPSHQQSRHTFLSQNEGNKQGMVVDYRQQQQAYGIDSSNKKAYFKEEWMHQQRNNYQKANQEGVALGKNSATNRSWRMNSADNIKQHHIQSMNSADNMNQHHIQATNSADNLKQHHIQATNSADNIKEHHIQAVNRNRVSLNDGRDANLHKSITIQRQDPFHVFPERAAKVHQRNSGYGQHGVVYHQTQASGNDKKVFQFPNKQAKGHQMSYGKTTNMKIESPKYYNGGFQHLTHVQHIDRPREGFQKPVAFKQDTDPSWAKDRWTISILVVLTCISMFSMIVQCWYCK